MLAKCALHPWIRSSQRRLCTETHLARPFPSPLLLLRGNLMSILDKDEERFGGGPEGNGCRADGPADPDAWRPATYCRTAMELELAFFEQAWKQR